MPKLPAFNKFMPNSLFWRAMMILVTPIICTQLLLAFIYIDGDLQRQADNNAKFLFGEIQVMEQLVGQNSFALSDAEAVIRGTYANNIVALEADKDLPASSDPFWFAFRNLAIKKAILNNSPYPTSVLFDDHGEYVSIFMRTSQGPWAARVETKSMITSKWHFILVQSLIGAVIFVLLAGLFLNNQVRPILRLARGAERFRRSGKPMALRVRGAREVRRAISAFNSMQEGIAQSFEVRTAMLTSVSHDLRTPLTRMRLELAMMPDNDARKGLERDIAEMEGTIMTYIQYIKDARHEPIASKKLSDFVKQASEPFANMHRIQIGLTNGDKMIDIHPDAMRRCLTNIIQNACDHGQQILIHNHWTAEDLVLEIDDDGPGIAKEQREEVLRPFTKGSKDNAGRYGGIGLGLSIASDIIAMHQGRLELDESMLGGLRVRLRIPIQNN